MLVDQRHRTLGRGRERRSVRTVGDACDHAFAECVIGLFKTEANAQIGPWKSMGDVEWESLKWVKGYHNRRFLGPFG